MQITIIGTGYVGLVVGACLADKGNNVVCVDIDTAKIAALKGTHGNRVVPIYEPFLDELIENNANAGRLHFTTNLKLAVERAAIIFFGTPYPLRRIWSS